MDVRKLYFILITLATLTLSYAEEKNQHPVLPTAEKVIELLDRGDADGLFDLMSEELSTEIKIKSISVALNADSGIRFSEKVRKWIDKNVDENQDALIQFDKPSDQVRAWLHSLPPDVKEKAKLLWNSYLIENFKETGRAFPMFGSPTGAAQATQTVVKLDMLDTHPTLFYGEALISFGKEGDHWKIIKIGTRLDTNFTLDGKMAENEGYVHIYDDVGYKILTGVSLDVRKVFISNDSKYLFFFLKVMPSVSHLYENWLKNGKDSKNRLDTDHTVSIYIDADSDKETGVNIESENPLLKPDDPLLKDRRGADVSIHTGIDWHGKDSLFYSGKGKPLTGTSANGVTETIYLEVSYRVHPLKPLNDDKSYTVSYSFDTYHDERVLGNWSKEGIEFAIPFKELGLNSKKAIRIFVSDQRFGPLTEAIPIILK